MNDIRLALKVDVDTYDGMRDGVPRLLRLFRELDIRASFFIPFGPDESGKAVFRVFRKKGFVGKMARTNPFKLYGLRTMLRGTLLPAPEIGASFPEIASAILKEGHELGIHGYNHVLWQDHLLSMGREKIKEQYDLARESYKKAVGRYPEAFAAPAWLTSVEALSLLDDYRFTYASDTRGRSPFFPSMAGRRFQTLQVPSTLPTMDELLGLGGLDADSAHERLSREIAESSVSFHVHSIHTEVEGAALFPHFERWLKNLAAQGICFVRIADSVAELLKERPQIPQNEIVLATLPGRAGEVACQKS